METIRQQAIAIMKQSSDVHEWNSNREVAMELLGIREKIGLLKYKLNVKSPNFLWWESNMFYPHLLKKKGVFA